MVDTAGSMRKLSAALAAEEAPPWEEMERSFRAELQRVQQDGQRAAVSELQELALQAHELARRSGDAEREVRTREWLEQLRGIARRPGLADDLAAARLPTGRNADVLGTLVGGPLRNRDLVARLSMTPSQVSNVTAHLEREGLVRRTRGEGRARYASLTLRGRRLATRLPVGQERTPAGAAPVTFWKHVGEAVGIV